MEQQPTMGRIVHYRLSRDDAFKINRRRTTGNDIADRIQADKWPLGAQAHIGNEVKEGDIFPALVVRVWDHELINAQAFLDGNDALWVLSAPKGNNPGCWNWPPRA